MFLRKAAGAHRKREERRINSKGCLKSQDGADWPKSDARTTPEQKRPTKPPSLSEAAEKTPL
ncbi:hypothetical protein DV515_00000389 [Chloebia gouldiae]|uniref:Uncharacterized protein n=1 Tax=Chloebia gouldiae TaxID=44316 RepID=A0A3L8T159_CHLGU|nr:hypothetical protein DV515_00000389 [Chloebia gouldiae]